MPSGPEGTPTTAGTYSLTKSLVHRTSGYKTVVPHSRSSWRQALPFPDIVRPSTPKKTDYKQ